MKSIKSTLFFALLTVFATHYVSRAQTQQVLWSDWETVYEEPSSPQNLKIEISFKLYPCKNGAIVGSFASYYRIRSNFQRPKATCKFSFTYADCDGKSKNVTIAYSMEKPEVKEWNQGQWFMGPKIVKINLPAKIEDYGTSKTASKTELDEAKKTYDGIAANYTTQLGKVKNQQSKEQYQTAFANSKMQFNNAYQTALQYYQQGNNSKLQEQVSLLKKINVQFDGNFNLLNDVVERQVAGSPQPTTGTVPVNNKTAAQSPLPSNGAANNSAAMAQLAKTRDYANSHVGLPQTQSVSESIKNFGNALGNYFESRRKDKERLNNFIDQQNQKAFNIIECAAQSILEDYFLAKHYYWSCSYTGLEPGEKKTDWPQVDGKLDSINNFVKQHNYLAAVNVIADKNKRSISVKTDKDYNYLKGGDALSGLSFAYLLSYYTKLDFNEKAKKTFEKDVAKHKASERDILQNAVSSMFYNKDTTYASYCLNELFKLNNVSQYRMKQALLFDGLIKKSVGLDKKSIEILKQSYNSLQKAYLINQTDFFKIGPSLINMALFGGFNFNYNEYFLLVQLAVLQELAHCLYGMYELSGEEKYLHQATDYYYGFFNTTK